MIKTQAILCHPHKFIQDYIARNYVIHAHFEVEVRRDCNLESGNFCAIFERWVAKKALPDGEPFKGLGGKSLAKRTSSVPSSEGWTDDMKVAVLVDYRQFLESPQENVIPSVIRLQTLDDCLRSRDDAADFVQTTPLARLPVSVDSHIVNLAFEDGKLHSPKVTITAYIGDCQLISQEVQGRPSTLNSIAKDCANSKGDFTVDMNGKNPVINYPPFRLELTTKGIGAAFVEFPNCTVKSFQVFVRPVQFSSNGIQDVHALYSYYGRFASGKEDTKETLGKPYL